MRLLMVPLDLRAQTMVLLVILKPPQVGMDAKVNHPLLLSGFRAAPWQQWSLNYHIHEDTET